MHKPTLKEFLSFDHFFVGWHAGVVSVPPGACVIKLITAVIYLDSMVKP
jgi:hypothetical protein